MSHTMHYRLPSFSSSTHGRTWLPRSLSTFSGFIKARERTTQGGGTEALTDEKKRGNTETKEENEKKTRRKHRNKNNTKRDRTRKHTQERGRGKTIKKKQKEDLVINSPDPTKEKETKELFFLYKKGKTIIFFNLSIAQREGNVAKAELPGWDRNEEVCWEWKVSFAFLLVWRKVKWKLFFVYLLL